VKLLARRGEEGRFFGMWDGGRGVVEATLAMAALFIFSRVMGQADGGENSREALVGVIYMYSFFLLAVSVLVAIFIKDDKTSKRDKADKFGLGGLKELCSNRLIFLVGGIIFMGYSVFWTFRTMSGFMQNSLGVTAVTAATVMVIAQWMRPVGGIIGGFLADKLGRANVVIGALMIGSTLLITIAFFAAYLPIKLAFVLILVCIIFLWAIRGTYWSILGECKVSNQAMGLAIGLISFIGYLPDVFSPMINTLATRLFGGYWGHSGYFVISAAFGFLGVGLVMLFKRLTKESMTDTKA